MSHCSMLRSTSSRTRIQCSARLVRAFTARDAWVHGNMLLNRSNCLNQFLAVLGSFSQPLAAQKSNFC